MKTRDNYCVYITKNKANYFYIGRALTEKVCKGKYTGSGTFYKEFRLKHPEGWETLILVDGLTLEQAVYVESDLLTDQVLKDDFNLNLNGQNGPITEALERFNRICPEYHEKLFWKKVTEAAVKMDLEPDELPKTITSGNLLLEAYGPPLSSYVLKNSQPAA